LHVPSTAFHLTMSTLKLQQRTEVMLYPRAKNGAPREQSSVALSRNAVEDKFHLPLAQAAESLGICVTALKRACRSLGIQKWPYTKPLANRDERATTSIGPTDTVQRMPQATGESGAACSPLGDDETKAPPDVVYSCQSSVCINAKQEAHSDHAPQKQQAVAEPLQSPSPLRSNDPRRSDEFGLLCSDGCFEPAEDVRVDATFIQSFIDDDEEQHEEEPDEEDE